ncbi:MAG TPA: ATP-binding cassette domain-containing protein, partial [Chloroflexota bacterium]|nr:ATP-binding cassette domain-containing protein [Chloroflexota bacterium]
EDVLRGFKGTILFVSHDRYLIDAVAQQIWEIADRRLTVHHGTWAEYVERRRQTQVARAAAAAAQRAAAEAADPARQAAQQARARAKELSQTRARLEQLDSRRTVIEEIQAVKPLGDEAARTYLGRFLFTGDDVFKRVSSLSGGERSRLALAKLALGEANFLVLDEPTNHLDIYAREALEDVLRGFKGTILFVSHDRYLIDAVAQQIWEIADKRLTVHHGTWAEYAERRRQTQSARAAEAAAQQARARVKELSQTRARLEQLEAELAASQARLAEVAARLEAASAAADVEEITELGRQHVTLTETLAEREEEWLALHETLEALEGLEATPGSKL